MLKRIITGLLLAGAVIGFLALRTIDVVFFDVFIIILLLLSGLEMMSVFKEHFDVFTFLLMLLLIGLYYPTYLYMNEFVGIIALYLLIFTVMAVYVVFNKKLSLETIKSFSFIMIYPLLLIATLFAVNQSEFALFGFLLVFLVAPLTDTFAYFFGVLIKGPKLCPEISPKKTIAGAVGGLVGGLCAALFVFYCTELLGGSIPEDFKLWMMICIGLIGSVLTQVGDLVASGIKRSVGVKDYGKILPGHGGLMDRIDGIIYVAVSVFIVFMFII